MSNITIEQEMIQYKGLYVYKTEGVYKVYNKDMRLVAEANNLLEVRLVIDMLRG